MKDDIKKMQEKELESIVGGSCYSDDDFIKLGLQPSCAQRATYHPLITTTRNGCPSASGYPRECIDCDYCRCVSGIHYCTMRSDELDPHNPHKSKWIPHV